MIKMSDKQPACMGWCHTYTLKKIDPRNIRVEDIDIDDIAHHLTLRNRFSCATPYPYSVAQHSVIVASILPEEFKLWGLLHDAGEFMNPDFPSPIKADPILAPVVGWEHRSLRSAIDRFGLTWPQPECVHTADRIVLATEARDLFGDRGEWGLEEKPLSLTIEETPWRKVKSDFLRLFDDLMYSRKQASDQPAVLSWQDVPEVED